MKKKILVRILGVTLALAVALSFSPVALAQPPPPPHQFWGTVTVAGGEPAAGVTVSAEIDYVEYESGVTDAEGRYGWDDPFMVPSDDPGTAEKDGGVNGDEVVFWVNITEATKTVVRGPSTFETGGATELNLSVGEAPEALPVAEFSASPLTGNAPLTVQFTDESLNMSDNASWYWEFGDVMCPYCEAGPFDTLAEANEHIATEHPGETLLMHVDWGPPYDPDDPNAQNPIHQYLQVGTYTVTLTVTTAYGSDTEVKADYIVVTETEPTPAPTDEDDVGVGVGGAAPTYYTETDIFGTEDRFRVDRDGEVQTTFTATSEDGDLTITIPRGTTALDKDGDRLDSLEAAVDESPPDPPEDTHVIGLVYDFGPDGATFDPPITLTWSYDPEALPEGVAEEDLFVAMWDGEVWVELDCVVDTETNTITAEVSGFSQFAVMIRIRLEPLPEPPAPAAFSLSNLTVKPALAQPKEVVTISVSVANTGGESGSYKVVLKLNGVKEAEKTATIAAGSSQDVSFSVTKEEEDSYAVTVDGLSGSFNVVLAPIAPPALEPPEEPIKPPVNWLLIVGIVAAVIVVALAILFWVRRRGLTG